MLAEIALAGAFGLVKGLYGPKRAKLHSSFAGAVVEEVLFRGLLRGPAGLAGFIASHQPRSVGRVADLAAGSLLYASAARRGGLFGAVCAHALHNACIAVGRSLK